MIEKLKSQLAALRARYDHGAIPAMIWKIIRELEIEIGWLEHKERIK